MGNKGGIVVFLLLLSFNCLYAQQKLSGTVLDKGTGQAIPYATVQAKNTRSSLTNENGEFDLIVPQLPAKLLVSHLNYAGASVDISTVSSAIKISLEAKTLTLKEVTVGNPGAAIMQDVSDKAMKNFEHSTYGKAFLRQIAYEGGEPSYMNEIFMNAEWKPYGLIAWHPTEARHLKATKGISYTNTSFFSFILSGYLANSIHKKPLLKKVDSLYTFKLVGTYDQNGEEIAKILCSPKPTLKGKRFEGFYYVNTVRNDVLKIEGTIKGMYFQTNGPVSIKNKETTFIAQYKLNSKGSNVLDYSILNTRNKLKVLGFGAQDTDLFSTLYMVEDDQISKTELKEVSGTIDDSSLVKAMNYNEDFWKKNQGIKRTVKEQSSIEILEKIPQVKK
jgi:hypothetical protein